jgi:hypothetical protein
MIYILQSTIILLTVLNTGNFVRHKQIPTIASSSERRPRSYGPHAKSPPMTLIQATPRSTSRKIAGSAEPKLWEVVGGEMARAPPLPFPPRPCQAESRHAFNQRATSSRRLQRAHRTRYRAYDHMWSIANQLLSLLCTISTFSERHTHPNLRQSPSWVSSSSLP